MNDTFAKALDNTLAAEVSITENGAVGYATSGKKLLDLNFAVSSLRKLGEKEIEHKFAEAFAENKEYAIRWMFMLRDVRGGLGERRSFRIMFKWLAQYDKEDALKLIPLLAEYGRYDDLFCLMDTSLEDDVIQFISKQFHQDIADLADGKPSISLLAKWMPSINTSSDTTRALANRLCKAFGMQPKNYRKALSSLRAKIDVVEKKMSANKWTDINYQSVPSKANIRYKDAFLKHDPAGRQKFLDKVESGEAKINSAANFPTDIVYKYSTPGMSRPDATLEALWKALPAVNLERNLLTVADVSGSMWTQVDNKSRMRAIDVSIALGIYTSEHLTGPFADKVMTFSDSPALVSLKNCKTLAQKLNTVERMDWGGSTNIAAVFDLILKTAVDNQLKQEDIPDVLIVSDMEFNQGTYSYGAGRYSANETALFKEIGRKFKAAGYAFPRLIYWNVASRTGTIPLTQNEAGVALVSGYSQNVLKMVMSNSTDPWQVLKEMLDTPRYAKVSEVLAA